MINLTLTVDEFEAVKAALVSESLNQIDRVTKLRTRLAEEADYLTDLDAALHAVELQGEGQS